MKSQRGVSSGVRPDGVRTRPNFGLDETNCGVICMKRSSLALLVLSSAVFAQQPNGTCLARRELKTELEKFE